MAPSKQQQFQHWKPGYGDAVRKFIISDNFQGAVQLAVGILFVSLFVFVGALRFPGSCVAVLLYIVVAVTAAPDNHVGTRIFLCGFMIGPMWLALTVGGVVGTIAKLAGDATTHMIMLCVLGPLALIPFAIVRVGTSHLYLWAMGMVSALYVGMPLIAGFPYQDLGLFWMRSVLFILVAALVAMFAGSVLSMVVLPSLASHALEDDVISALRQLGHHLSGTASHLFRPMGKLEVLPGHMHGMHPLLLQHETDSGQLPAKPLVPGLLDKEPYHYVTAQDVYVALMDWFEHMSRPPGAQHKSSGNFMRCTQASITSSDSSVLAKSTFYGADAAGLAAAVAAAAADSFSGWTDVDVALDEEGTLDEGADDSGPFRTRGAANTSTLAKGQSTDLPQRLDLRQTSIAEDTVDTYQLSSTKSGSAYSRVRAPHLQSLRLGSGIAAASYVAVQAKAAAAAGVLTSSAAFGTSKSADTDSNNQQKRGDQARNVSHPSRAPRLLTPSPSIADVRQVLAHANQLLNAASAEPQWLRGSARRFETAAWADVIAKSQLLATRLSALDLVKRDHMTLLDASHSFPLSQGFEQLLKNVFASAAAVLSLLADQLADRSGKCQVSAAGILQTADWQQSKEQLLQLVEQALVQYWHAVHAASPEAPVTLPRGHWVRQWMFFNLATVGVIEAVDLLGKAAAAALAAPVRRSLFSRALDKQQQQQRHSTLDQCQQQPGAGNQAAAESLDIEAGPAAEKRGGAHDLNPQKHQQQLQPESASMLPPPAAAGQGHSSSSSNKLSQRLHSSFRKHTAWVTPWLPMALNELQFKHLHSVVTKNLPAMFSSKQAFKHQLKGRRFRAGLKYWFVLSVVLIAILVLLYRIPTAFRYAPNFGYSAAAVGMSDRVESTVHKVIIWVASSIVGAAIGWALMAHPAMANNPYALAAVMCAICLMVGSLGRSKNTLVTLYTLMTVASIVLCQYTTACCADTGSSMMAIVRGASVAAAAVFAVAVQNLVWPWYTSTWALEQLGLVYQEAADMLADLVCEIYAETDLLLQQHLTSTTLDAGSTTNVFSRLSMLDAAVTRVQQQLAEQEQQQFNGASRSTISNALSSRQMSTDAAAAAETLDAAAAASGNLDAPAAAAAAAPAAATSNRTNTGISRFTPSATVHEMDAELQPASTVDAVAAGRRGQSHVSRVASRMSSATEFNTARTAGLVLDESNQAFVLHREMTQLLQRRQQQRQQKMGAPDVAAAGGGGGGAAAGSAAAGSAAAAAPSPSSPQQLQVRLLKPLVQVKISLMLDTTAWSSGLYATPPVVLRLLQSMFDVADALGALQQASSVKVEALSGSWDWTLVHMAQSYGQLLLEVIAMADATLLHVMQPSKTSAAELLQKIQDVQHQRYEYFTRSRDLRRLLHMAIASDEKLFSSHMAEVQNWHLQGHMRYSAAVYVTGKVLDRMTAVARCALETRCKM